MKKIKLIIQREYLTRVTKRSFIVMTLLTPVLMVGLMALVGYLAMDDQKSYEVLVADFDGIVSVSKEGERFSRFPNRFKDSEAIKYTFTRDTLSSAKFEESRFDILVEFDGSILQNQAVDLYYKDYPGARAKSSIRNNLEDAIEEYKVTQEIAMDYETYKRLKTPLKVLEKDIAKVGTDTGGDNVEGRVGIGFGFGLVIYLFIFIYGMQVMRGVIEEKTNRVVEVLISSVKPFQLMLGKIIGIAMVGLTQIIMWVVLIAVLTSALSLFVDAQVMSPAQVVDSAALPGTADLNANQELANIMDNEIMRTLFAVNWPLMIGTFIFYFLGGFLVYAALFAAIGAAVDSETDTQQFMIPVSLPLGIGFLISELLILNPGGSIAKIFSLIPLTSPVVMMPMVSMGAVEKEPWILIVSMLLLIGFFIFTVWLAGRIYRVGILMYGKKASYKELYKWLFYKE